MDSFWTRPFCLLLSYEWVWIIEADTSLIYIYIAYIVNLLYSMFLKNETWILIFFARVLRKGLKLTRVALLNSQGWLCSPDPGLAQPSSQVPGLHTCTSMPGSVCSYVETLSQWFPLLSPALMEAFPYPAISPHVSKMTSTNDSNDPRKETPVPFIETRGHDFCFLLVSIPQYLQALILVDTLHDS